MVARFVPIHNAHSPDVVSQELFEHVKGYPFRPYTLDAAAQTLFEQNFDHHVAEQEAAYLRDHAAAKLHGKMKTANLRYGLQVHLLEQARAAASPQQWNTTVEKRALIFADIVGAYLDKVSEHMDDFFKKLVRAAADAPGGGGSKAGRDSATVSMDTLQGAPDATRQLLFRLLSVILAQPTVWLTGNALRANPEVRACLDEAGVDRSLTDEYLFKAGVILSFSRLGACLVSKNTSGPKTYFFVRRALLQDDADYLHWTNVVQALGLRVDAYRGHTDMSYAASPPKSAPPLVMPPHPTAAEFLTIQRKLRSMLPSS